jgi:hypothetical protein
VSYLSKQTGALWGAFAALALLGLSGCSYTGSDKCDDVCACTGCPSSEYDLCINLAEAEEKEADYQGCNDQYDVYYSCVSDRLDCIESVPVETACDHERDSFKNCLK